jgi:hypothetical protein
MTDDKQDKLARGIRKELTEAEALERDLDRLFGSLQPPYGAQDRLMAQLQQPAFSERDLVLDREPIEGPYSFEQALAEQEALREAEQADQVAGSDLLAAGLEEEPIEENDKPE